MWLQTWPDRCCLSKCQTQDRELLRQLATDPEPEVRAAAMQALERLDATW
jgi:uncharacterized protein (DUF2336 family)